MMRNPRRWSPYGTEPPALLGSREAPTTAIVVAPARIFCGVLLVLRDLDVRLSRRGQRDFEHVLDPARQVERHLLTHALGHVVEIFLVALGEDDLLEAHAVRRQHLLLDASD